MAFTDRDMVGLLNLFGDIIPECSLSITPSHATYGQIDLTPIKVCQCEQRLQRVPQTDCLLGSEDYSIESAPI